MSEIFRGKQFFIEMGLLVLCFASFVLVGLGAEFGLISAGSIVVVADHARGRKKSTKLVE